MYYAPVGIFFYRLRASAIRLKVRAADDDIIALPPAFLSLFDRDFVSAHDSPIYAEACFKQPACRGLDRRLRGFGHRRRRLPNDRVLSTSTWSLCTPCEQGLFFSGG